MFNEDQITYLENHREYYTKLKESGALTRISSVVVQGFQRVYKEAIGAQKFNAWCSACVIELIELCYLNFDKFKEDARRTKEIQPATAATRPTAPGIKSEIPEPQSKGKVLPKRRRTTRKG